MSRPRTTTLGDALDATRQLERLTPQLRRLLESADGDEAALVRVDTLAALLSQLGLIQGALVTVARWADEFGVAAAAAVEQAVTTVGLAAPGRTHRH